MEKIDSTALRVAILLTAESPRAIAQLAGITPATLLKFLHNDGAQIQLATLSKLARVLKVNPMDLVLD